MQTSLTREIQNDRKPVPTQKHFIKEHLVKKIFLTFLITVCYFNAYATTETSSYLINRIQMEDKRYLTLLSALELLDQRHVKILVETGTARDGDRNFVGDGGSTIIFADWATQNEALLYSVDIDPSAIENAKNVTTVYADHIQFVCDNSIKFLNKFEKQIDFLYLDSFDFDFGNPSTSQVHHLKEIIAAYPKLHKNSIVMIDDCDLPQGGKGALVIEYLTARGWEIFQNGYQIIMLQRE